MAAARWSKSVFATRGILRDKIVAAVTGKMAMITCSVLSPKKGLKSIEFCFTRNLVHFGCGN